MSWSYSPVLVAEYLGQCCSGIVPSVPLSATPTPDQYYWPDKPMEYSRLSRFGMTCAPLTGDHGAELLTWYLEAFHARTSAQPEKVQGSTANAQGCGEKWPGLLAKYDPATHSLKTVQCSLFEDLIKSSPILPRWGLMRDGELYPLPMSVRPICESASGYWQTPVADDCVGRKIGKWNSRGEPKLSAQVLMAAPTRWPTPVSSDATCGAVIGKNDTFYETSTGMPRKINQNGKDGSVGLGRLVQMWPTPRANDAEKRGDFDAANPRNGLAGAVKMWPTPTMTDYKGTPTAERAAERAAESSRGVRLPEEITRRTLWPTPCSNNGTGGATGLAGGAGSRLKLYKMLGEEEEKKMGYQSLNPYWVEWLMGWVIGWTDLKPLAMARFREFEQQHGIF